ncbi:dihydrofolate reductase [Microbispora sp. RL4-1S]|uniref:Dihydrofolate reductase n=1 Tax=Microbispora oryzae TaxID=2806554 RepID=A0A941AH19_9ACTN|nr:dihydrofolate reductase family protein [Microbispora oryzae]MBP2702207.1 dihydrofolate reductase [Microbispora oryzae]
MRKIIAGFFISLDGVVESPADWHLPYFNDEMGAAVSALMTTDSDSLLMGRTNYEQWAAYWPTSEDPFAEHINAIPKYVVSTTLEKAEWQNSTLIRGDLAEEMAKLKAQPGKGICMSGSTTLARSLLKQGLIDELRLLVHPIVVGSGARLFEGFDQLPLKLVSSETFETGVLSLIYQPAEK